MKEKDFCGLTEEQIQEAFSSKYNYHKEIDDYNSEFMKQLPKIYTKHFPDLMQYCCVNGKFEFVNKPLGNIIEEKYGPYKRIWVQQWNYGMEPDSYRGYIYARIKKDQWLKIPFEC